MWKQAKTRNSEVQSYLDAENFDYQLQYYDTHEEQYQALADGTVDVISNVSLSPIQGTRIIEKFAPRAYYFASSSKNEQLLKQLDETISIIGQVQPSLQEVLFDKFFRNTRYIFSPTDSQKEYFASLETLKVLCVDHDAPYVYQKEGQPAGMLISVVNDFAEKSGLNVEYTFCENKTQAEEKLLEAKYYLMNNIYDEFYYMMPKFKNTIYEDSIKLLNDIFNHKVKNIKEYKNISHFYYLIALYYIDNKRFKESIITLDMLNAEEIAYIKYLEHTLSCSDDLFIECDINLFPTSFKLHLWYLIELSKDVIVKKLMKMNRYKIALETVFKIEAFKKEFDSSW